MSVVKLAGGLLAMLLVGLPLVGVVPVQLSGVFASTLPGSAALVLVLATALLEECAKAAGVGLSDLRRSRFNWFWIVFLVGGVFGLVEQGLILLAQGLKFRFDRTVEVAAMLHGPLGHIALALCAVVAARMLGRGVFGWMAGVAVATAAHMAHNAAGMPASAAFGGGARGALVWVSVSGAVFVTLIATAFVLRHRLDWRSRAT